MISIIRNRKEIGIKDYVCDKAEELSDIDIRTAAMGSTCFVIDENVTYMLNGKKIWIPVSNGSGANPGGGSDAEDPPGRPRAGPGNGFRLHCGEPCRAA